MTGSATTFGTHSILCLSGSPSFRRRLENRRYVAPTFQSACGNHPHRHAHYVSIDKMCHWWPKIAIPSMNLDSHSGRLRPAFRLLFLIALVRIAILTLFGAEDQPFGLERRVPWTTSCVIGSPDPPLPYTVEKTFTNIVWKAPMFIAAE